LILLPKKIKVVQAVADGLELKNVKEQMRAENVKVISILS
jgi:16S rRNA (guanine527-N7)-methyltransferase